MNQVTATPLTTIECADALAFLQTLPSQSVDACITDPPFGIGYAYDEVEQYSTPDAYWQWFAPIYAEICRVVTATGFIAIWQSTLYFKHLWAWFGDDIRIYISAKNFVQLRPTAMNYGFDPIVVSRCSRLTNKPPRNLDFYVSKTAQAFLHPDVFAHEHPCPRPLDQVDELVRNFVEPGSLVLDCFVGSGTTALAALQAGCAFVGCDVWQPYVDLTTRRLAEFTDRPSLY